MRRLARPLLARSPARQMQFELNRDIRAKNSDTIQRTPEKRLSLCQCRSFVSTNSQAPVVSEHSPNSNEQRSHTIRLLCRIRMRRRVSAQRSIAIRRHWALARLHGCSTPTRSTDNRDCGRLCPGFRLFRLHLNCQQMQTTHRGYLSRPPKEAPTDLEHSAAENDE